MFSQVNSKAGSCYTVPLTDAQMLRIEFDEYKRLTEKRLDAIERAYMVKAVE